MVVFSSVSDKSSRIITLKNLEVVEIVRNKIVVGHSIEYDLASLKINPEGTVYIHPILKIKEIVFINKKKTL